MTTKPPSRTAEQFVLRLPEGMRGRIAEVAKASGRSMNAEIVARLEASFAEDVSVEDRATLRKLVAEEIENYLHARKGVVNSTTP